MDRLSDATNKCLAFGDKVLKENLREAANRASEPSAGVMIEGRKTGIKGAAAFDPFNNNGTQARAGRLSIPIAAPY